MLDDGIKEGIPEDLIREGLFTRLFDKSELSFDRKQWMIDLLRASLS
jgi:hypothetical protein